MGKDATQSDVMYRRFELPGAPRVEGDVILFDAVLTTEAPAIVNVPDPYDPKRKQACWEIIPMANCDLSRAEAGGGIPMLYQHVRDDLPVGDWSGLRTEADKLLGAGALKRKDGTVGGTEDPEGNLVPVQPVTALRAGVADRSIRFVSLGYRVTGGYDRIPKGGRYGDFQSPDRDILVARKWLPFEASLVTVPEDAGAMFRSLAAGCRLTDQTEVNPVKRALDIQFRRFGAVDEKFRDMQPTDGAKLMDEIHALMSDEDKAKALKGMLRDMSPEQQSDTLKALCANMPAGDVVKFIKSFVPDAAKAMADEGAAAGAEQAKAFARGFDDVVRGLPEDLQADFRRDFADETDLARLRKAADREKTRHKKADIRETVASRAAVGSGGGGGGGQAGAAGGGDEAAKSRQETGDRMRMFMPAV